MDVLFFPIFCFPEEEPTSREVPPPLAFVLFGFQLPLLQVILPPSLHSLHAHRHSHVSFCLASFMALGGHFGKRNKVRSPPERMRISFFFQLEGGLPFSSISRFGTGVLDSWSQVLDRFLREVVSWLAPHFQLFPPLPLCYLSPVQVVRSTYCSFCFCSPPNNVAFDGPFGFSHDLP